MGMAAYAAKSSATYLKIAEQLLARARSAQSPQEADGYLAQAELWRRLGEARIDGDGSC